MPDYQIVGTNYFKKLYSMNDNIGVSFSSAKSRDYENGHGEIDELVEEFCRKKTFNSPEDAAHALLDYVLYRDSPIHREEMRKHYALDGEPQFVIHVAGYEKFRTLVPVNPSTGQLDFQKEHQEEIDDPYPVVCTICTVPGLRQQGWKRISHERSTGLWQCGNMRQIKPYVDMINNDKDFLDHLTLQEAVNATMYLFNAARGFEWMIDHIKTISEDFEMLSITSDGIKWLKKHELEVKEKQEVIL